jgi:PKD repeat protein
MRLRTLFAAATLAFALNAFGQGNPGVLAVSCIGGGVAGQSTTCSWSGTVIPSSPPCTDVIVGWSAFGSGIVFSATGTGNTFTFTPPSIGMYGVGVGYAYFDPADPAKPGCGSGGSGSIIFNVYDVPFLTGLATAPVIPIVDQPVAFTAGAPFPHTPTRWDWIWGDGSSCSNCYTGPHTYTQPGTYHVTLNASNPAGAVTAAYDVTVAPDPPRITFMDYGPAGVLPVAGTPLQFTSVVAGDTRDQTILWDFGDGATSHDQNPAHTFPAPDSYNVTLTVTNAWGTTQQMELVPVQAAPGSPPSSPSFTYNPPTIVTGQNVSFQGSATGTVTLWRWDFGDNTEPEFIQNPAHAFAQPGNYTVQMHAKNQSGETIAAHFLQVFPGNVPPVANFIWSPLSPDVFQTVQFSDLSAGATSWNWSFGDGGTSTAENPTHAYAIAGDKNVTLTVHNAFGSDTKTLVLGCGTGNALSANFRWDPATPAHGQSVSFIDTSTGSPETWAWLVSDGFTSSAQNPTHAFAADGDYPVTLTVTKGLATSSFTQTVHVASGVALAADFSISPSPPVQGKPVTFQDTSSGNPTKWSWSFSDGFTANSPSVTRTLTSPGRYTVDLTVSLNDGTSSFREKGFDLLVKPIASFTASGSPVVGTPVTFTDTSQNSPTAWSWSIDGTVVSTLKSFSYTFTLTGNATVSLVATNDAGSDSTSQILVVQDKPASDRPGITNLSENGGPCFFQGISTSLPFQAAVDWRGDQPAVLDILVNGSNHQLVPATNAGGSFSVDTSLFKSGAAITDNTVSVMAIASNQDASDPVTQHFPALSVDLGTKNKISNDSQGVSITSSVGIPLVPWEETVDIPDEVPLIGGFPFGFTEFQILFEETYKSSCSYSSKISGGGGITGGGFTAAIKVDGTLTRTISAESGISSSGTASIGAEGSLAVATKAVPIVKVIPALTATCDLPLVSKVCSILTVTGTLQGTFGGQLNFTFDDKGDVQYKDATMTGLAGVDITATAEVKPVKISVFGGGNLSLTGSLTAPYFRSASATLEAGAKAKVYAFSVEAKASYTCIISPNGATCGSPAGAASLLTIAPVKPNAADAPEVPGDGQPVILSNLGENASSAAAMQNDRELIVYLGENSAVSASPQRLDLRYIARNGTGSWSAPKPITNDSTGDFGPALVFTADGRAVVAWERLHDNTLTNADIQSAGDLPKLYAQMEIAAATYDPNADSWSSPQMLTSNALFDHSPALVPLSDGRVVLAWIRETPDASGDQQLVARILQGDSWGAEQTLASGLRGVDSLSLASKANDAQLVFARGSAVSVLTFHDNAWSAMSDLSAGPGSDSSASVAYDADGSTRVLWLRDGAIVTRRLSDSSDEVVRDTASTGGVANPLLTITPDGTDFVTWLDRGDVFARVRDPRSGQWSSDIQMTKSDEQEDRPAVLFDSTGAVHLVGSRSDASDVVNLVDINHSFRVDLSAIPQSMTGTPAQPAAGSAVTLAADLQNVGDIPVRDAVVVLTRGRDATAPAGSTTTIAGEWLPGETKHVTFNSVYDASQPTYTIAVDPTGASGDALMANNAVSFSFTNQPPIACLQASAMTGNVPLTVTLDAGCSTDRDGTVVAQSWAFPDGTTATTRTTSHTFTTAGTYTISLTAIDDMGATSATTVTIVVGPAPDWRAPSTSQSLYIPVVARAHGAAGSFFVSDVSLLDADPVHDLTVNAVYLPDGRSDTYTRQITLRAGQSLDADDIVARFFGAADSGGSLRLDLSHPHAVALARTYDDQPTGTAGFSSDALFASGALEDGDRGIVLQHWIPGNRTNIGFTEISGAATQIDVTAFDEHNANLGTKSFAVPPYGHVQVNGDPLLQSRGRIELAVHGGKAFVYVSTVDGQSNDPMYQVPARPGTGNQPATLLIPIVGHFPGAFNTVWRSDVRVFNPTAAAQSITIELRLADGVQTRSVTLGAGETASYDDVIAALFPQLSNASGAMAISAPSSILATSRTYNVTSQGTYGLYIPARSSGELLDTGDTAHLIHLSDNASYRTNFGFTSFDADSAVTVRAFDSDGVLLGQQSYTTPAGKTTQIGSIFRNLGLAGDVDSARLEVTVTAGRVIAYASVNDNRTGDGTYIEATKGQ